MKIKEVRVDVGETVGLPDYSSVRIQVGVTVEVEPEETPTDAKARAMAWVKDTVHKEVDKALIGVGRDSKYGKVRLESKKKESTIVEKQEQEEDELPF